MSDSRRVFSLTRDGRGWGSAGIGERLRLVPDAWAKERKNEPAQRREEPKSLPDQSPDGIPHRVLSEDDKANWMKTIER